MVVRSVPRGAIQSDKDFVSDQVLGFGNWWAVGDLREQLQGRDTEASTLGLGRLLAAKEGRSRPQLGERQHGGRLGFCCGC